MAPLASGVSPPTSAHSLLLSALAAYLSPDVIDAGARCNR